MSKIVFLNMADDLHVDGHKAVEALRNKYPATGGGLFSKSKEQVFEVQMVPIYRAWKKGQPLQRDMAQIKTKVAAAEKVMLSVHGPMKEVDHALIRDPSGGPGEQVTYQDLGRFLLELFESTKCHNFTLVTCFAARSSAYNADHQNLALVDWTDSFAYKLFNELCPAREVRMTARTGELSFNTVSGSSEVQTELSVQGTLDNESIRAEEAVAKSQKWWSENVGRLTTMKGSPSESFAINLTIANNQTTPAQKLHDLRQLRLNHGLPSTSVDKQKCLEYLDNLIRLTEASSRQADPVKGKYGKLIYRYIHGYGICIFAKYPTPTMVYPVQHGPVVVDPNLLRKFNKR
jgi:hypothetical protein